MPKHTMSSGPPGSLLRPDWKAGVSLHASDLQLDQQYRLQRLRRHLRLVHGWGVVCGLNVVAGANDWEVWICPGYGIGPCGDEIELRHRTLVDLRDYLWTRPVGVPGQQLWIALEAVEKPLSGDATACGSQCGCGCQSHQDHTSRSADTATVVVLWAPPATPISSINICSGQTPTCPPCPKTCELVLAVITLPASPDGLLAIDNVAAGGF